MLYLFSVCVSKCGLFFAKLLKDSEAIFGVEDLDSDILEQMELEHESRMKCLEFDDGDSEENNSLCNLSWDNCILTQTQTVSQTEAAFLSYLIYFNESNTIDSAFLNLILDLKYCLLKFNFKI